MRFNECPSLIKKGMNVKDIYNGTNSQREYNENDEDRLVSVVSDSEGARLNGKRN